MPVAVRAGDCEQV